MMDFAMGEGDGLDQRVQTLQTSCCSEDIRRSPYEMVEWVLDLLFLDTCKENPTHAFLLVQASKGKMMANNNNKLKCPNSILIILLKMKTIMTTLQ